jgi:hypothetical protein
MPCSAVGCCIPVCSLSRVGFDPATRTGEVADLGKSTGHQQTSNATAPTHSHTRSTHTGQETARLCRRVACESTTVKCRRAKSHATSSPDCVCRRPAGTSSYDRRTASIVNSPSVTIRSSIRHVARTRRSVERPSSARRWDLSNARGRTRARRGPTSDVRERVT